jgi:serine/threonine protein kinase
MTNDNIINKKYKLLEKIGNGSFGSIYKAENIRTKELVAIKVENIESETKLLKNESIIYQYLSNIQGIPSIKWYGKDSTNYYMVINLLGDSFEIIKKKKNFFSLKLTLEIGIKLVQLLKTIHERGLIHRDIKPDNFLLGPNNDNKQIYLIDFGFCKSYIHENKHIEMKKTSSLIGSKTYASINAHNFIELSRRDDLESLGYLLLYFYLGTLKWKDISDLNNSQDVNKVIKKMKTDILEDVSIPNILLDYLRYVRCLDFDKKPDYDKIICDFTKEIKNIQCLV